MKLIPISYALNLSINLDFSFVFISFWGCLTLGELISLELYVGVGKFVLRYRIVR